METTKCIEIIKNKNGSVKYFMIKNSKYTKQFTPDGLKEHIKKGDFYVENLTLTTDGYFIYNDEEHMKLYNDNLYKLEQLRNYLMKEQIIGTKLFDFVIDIDNFNIYICRYYDIPNRKIISIPDFVDGFKLLENINVGAFNNCCYVEKISSNSNIKGSLDGLFSYFEGNKLDLSEFNTSNIDDMTSMFNKAEIKNLILGNKFNTKNVVETSYMFCNSNIENINLGDNFDTSCLELTQYMFYTCKTNSITLGSKFDTSYIHYSMSMFTDCTAKNIIVGKDASEYTIKFLKEKTTIPILQIM